MDDETIITLKNYDWLIRNERLDNIELVWESDTLILRNGGVVITEVTRPGFTPATRPPEESNSGPSAIQTAVDDHATFRPLAGEYKPFDPSAP